MLEILYWIIRHFKRKHAKTDAKGKVRELKF